MTPDNLEHIVAKAVAAAISVVRDKLDSCLKSVEKHLATIERIMSRLKTSINGVLQIPVFLMMIVSSIKESMLLVDCPL